MKCMQKARIPEVSIYDERSLEERGKLGISLFESDKLEGVLIADVFDKSPADKSGLKEEDLIVGINGLRVLSKNDLITTLMKMEPGDEINLKILRDGVTKVFQLKLD